jgi:hypothetical protein
MCPDVDDPRLLTTEPLALDLLNTRWARGDVLLDAPDGAAAWLAAVGHPEAPTGPAARDALVAARDAIRAALGGDPGPLNAVLARGHLAERLGPGGPERLPEVGEADWRVPWLAAADLLELLRTGRHRIRVCAAHDCVLHFYDDSRSGRRQWCSMATCGNRAKARRHYDRTRRAQ